MFRRRGARIEERLIGDALSEHMDRVDTGRDLWPTISDLLSRRKLTQFLEIAAVVATTVVVSLFVFLAVVRPWSNSDYQDYQFDYQYTGYLAEQIPPCQPAVGASVEPCGSGLGHQGGGGGGEGSIRLGDEPRSMMYFLDDEGGTFAAHMVVRATYLPDTVRCAPAGAQFRLAFYAESDYSDITATHCFADIRVNEYVLGSGPPTLTVLVANDYIAYNESVDAELYEPYRLEMENLLLTGGWDNILGRIPAGGIEGREAVLFLGPARDGGVLSWQVFVTWDIEQRPDNTVIAVHPLRAFWERRDDYQTHRAAVEMELPAFRQAVGAAHQARIAANGGRIGPAADLPMIQTDANRLSEFSTSLGHDSHPDGPPVSPPPACGMVTGTTYKPGLMLDCQYLLGGKDELQGTGALNWGTGTAIGSWDGITTGGTPSRVTKVLLRNKSLTGVIPSGLSGLSEITHLDLRDNSLTGSIPRELGGMDSLEEIHLSGNSLTGCIPDGLKDVPTNDLSSLGLLYCPPAPSAPVAGTTTETTIPLTWTALTGAAKYRLEYRKTFYTTGPVYNPWLLSSDSITTTSRTVEGLLCRSRYQHGGRRLRPYEFRLSAYGDGTTYAAAWSAPSDILTATAANCTLPRFQSAPYRFSVAEDAPVGTVVGTVQAVDNSGLPVVYDIDGSRDSASMELGFWYFDIDPTTGVITVAEPLISQYGGSNLIVTATDTAGGTVSIEVPVELTKSCASGGAVLNPADNPGLLRDCQVLLALKDTLRGTTSLNWSADRTVGSWDGITVSGSPKRVTVLELESNGLTGILPEEMGNLDKLQTLYLSGNSFTGCVPPVLRDVDENDLDSLDLPNCA